jgi:hypothetical protein
MAAKKKSRKRSKKSSKKEMASVTIKRDHIPLKILEDRLKRLSGIVAMRQKNRKRWI